MRPLDSCLVGANYVLAICANHVLTYSLDYEQPAYAIYIYAKSTLLPSYSLYFLVANLLY